jgi:hypothetical protein
MPKIRMSLISMDLTCLIRVYGTANVRFGNQHYVLIGLTIIRKKWKNEKAVVNGSYESVYSRPSWVNDALPALDVFRLFIDAATLKSLNMNRLRDKMAGRIALVPAQLYGRKRQVKNGRLKNRPGSNEG